MIISAQTSLSSKDVSSRQQSPSRCDTDILSAYPEHSQFCSRFDDHRQRQPCFCCTWSWTASVTARPWQKHFSASAALLYERISRNSQYTPAPRALCSGTRPSRYQPKSSIKNSRSRALASAGTRATSPDSIFVSVKLKRRHSGRLQSLFVFEPTALPPNKTNALHMWPTLPSADLHRCDTNRGFGTNGASAMPRT